MKTSYFSRSLLAWFDQHGRKDLPWQKNINAYRVWVSEIMLQQTQVATVIPYFEKFIKRFPDVRALASAPIDDVLHLWTGLGYYARARNLHKCAQVIVTEYDDEFPADVDALCELSGIGRSTAGAICSIAFKQSTAILDGNVKRVLARYHRVSGWPGKGDVQKELWLYAERYTPKKRCNDYTQAIMDLGATLCTRSRPNCAACPLKSSCEAFAEGKPTEYPGKKPKKTLPVKATQFLMIRNPVGDILLQQRPSTGIWGGLWSFPELATDECPETHCEQHFAPAHTIERWDTHRHTFSHFHLDISPVILQLGKGYERVGEEGKQWINLRQPGALGLAAPVKKLLLALSEQDPLA